MDVPPMKMEMAFAMMWTIAWANTMPWEFATAHACTTPTKMTFAMMRKVWDVRMRPRATTTSTPA